jgi:hypothetical protein
MEKGDESEKIRKCNWRRAETENRGKSMNKKEKNKVKENNKKMKETKNKYRRKEAFCFVGTVVCCRRRWPDKKKSLFKGSYVPRMRPACGIAFATREREAGSPSCRYIYAA